MMQLSMQLCVLYAAHRLRLYCGYSRRASRVCHGTEHSQLMLADGSAV